MGKDPAFLFYPGDWLGGTMGMTFEEKGAYLELLLFQFNNGKFSKAQAKQVLSICSASVVDKVLLKFTTDGTFFWKQRLTDEIERRRKFSESRQKNANSKKTPQKKEKAYAKHMETETENRTDTKNNNKEAPRDFFKPDIPGDDVVMPFNTQPFRNLWAAWKESRWKNWDEEVYGMHGEQAELKKLQGMNYQQCEQAIGEAISGKWKNLYPKKQNGTSTGTFKKPGLTAEGSLDRLNSYTD